MPTTKTLIIICIISLVFIGGCGEIIKKDVSCIHCPKHIEQWNEDCLEQCDCINKSASVLSPDCRKKSETIPDYCWIQAKLPEDTIWSLNKSNENCKFPDCETWTWCYEVIKK